MRARTLLIAAGLVSALAACDSAGEVVTEDPVAEALAIGGTYSGLTEVAEEDGFRLETETKITIPEGTESGEASAFTAVLETARIGGGARSVSGTLTSGTGRYDHPTITLSFLGEDVDGTVSGDRETIRLEVEAGESATLTRE